MSEAMCHQHNIRPGALHGFLDNCYPLFANRVLPITCWIRTIRDVIASRWIASAAALSFRYREG
jgi:hypothetical protein